MQNRWTDSNQESMGDGTLFCVNNVPFPVFCCQRMWHKSYTQFLFFQIIRQNAVNDGFWYPVLSSIILQLARWLSFKTTATQAMFLFVFVVLGLPLHSTSSIDSSPAADRLCYRNTVACDTDESPNAFTNISHIFAAANPALQQNFIAAHCLKLFSIVICNTSTEHTILQNALILPHIDGLTSICRWRIVLVTTSQMFITNAPLVSIFEAQSQNLWDTLCIVCKVGNWWTCVVFTTKRMGIQREHMYSIMYRRWLCIRLSSSCILPLAAQYLSFCSQMEIEENREECRACFIRGLYQDLHKKYEDALAKNAELVKLKSELCAENERLREKQQ